MSDNAAEGLRGLREAIERLDVFAHEYATAAGAMAAFRRAEAQIRAGQAAGGGGASVWRARELESTTWRVFVCDDGCRLRERVSWKPGAEVELDEELRRSLIERFLATLVTAHVPGTGESHSELHFGSRGAFLRRGGVLDPRIGQG